MISGLLEKARWRKRGNVEYRIFIRDTVVTGRTGRTILESALAVDLAVPYSCQVGACGECRCKVSSGMYKTLRPLDYMFNDKELSEGMTLACQTIPESDLNVVFPARENEWINATVASVRYLDDAIIEVALVPEAGIEFCCGQVLEVRRPDSGVTRTYSIVNEPDIGEKCEIRLHIKLRDAGLMSEWWREQAKGSTGIVQIGRPFGNFGIPAGRTPDKFLCIAGGSAMGVVAGLVQAWGRRNPIRECVVVAINRHGLSAYHAKMVADLKHEMTMVPRLVNVAYPQWCEGGDTLADIIEQWSPFEGDDDWHALVCGSQPVVDAAIRHLNSAGFGPQQVSFDSFLPTN